MDYSFGLPVANKAMKELKTQQYGALEQTFKHMAAEDLSRTVDYFALSNSSQALEKWKRQTGDPNLIHLVQGVELSHDAWKARSGALASEITHEMGMQFLQLLEQAIQRLEQVKISSMYYAHAQARLIRAYMGHNELDKAHEAFRKSITAQPHCIAAYAFMAVAVQPKWGGSIEQVQDFLNRLPEDAMLKDLVHLMLIFDSLQMEENYFEAQEADLSDYAQRFIVKMDQHLSKNPMKSTLKYEYYNNIAAIAEVLGLTQLSEKYYKKVNGYYTLHPYGILD